MSAKATRPILLSDKEKNEFDHVTLDSIHEWRDVSKLRRLEQYMTQEGFPTTASATAMRIKALSAGASISDETRRKELEAEYKSSAHELMSWTHKIVSEEQELSSEPTVLSTAAPGIRKGVKIASDTAFSTKDTQSALPKLKGDSTVGGNVRSGPEYYAKWDRVAENELKKLQSEDQKELSTPSAATSSNMPVTSAENPENTQRICKAAEGMSPAERRRQAESERHKGNDYFRAHDYRAAVEAFTVAAELDPTSVAARANRAAAYLKLHMWSDAETDACETLRLDPGNLKAQLRRAQARCELGQMSLAREDALAVLAKVPDEPSMLALVEKADSALKKTGTRMTIEEMSTESSTEPSSQVDKESAPLTEPMPGSSNCNSEGSPSVNGHTTNLPNTSPHGLAGPTQEKATMSAADASRPTISNATVKGQHRPCGSESRPGVADQTCLDGKTVPGDTFDGPLRRVPIITDCSDSDSEAADAECGITCSTDKTFTRCAVGNNTFAASPSLTRPGVSADVGSGGSSCTAADVSSKSEPSAIRASDAVRIQVIEDDEEASAADDALLAAALPPKSINAAGAVRLGASSPSDIKAVEEEKLAGQVDAAAVPGADAPQPAVHAAGTGGAASRAPTDAADECLMQPTKAPEPIKSPEAVAEELMEKGRAAFAAGSLQEAKEIFTAAVNTWPLLAAAYSNRAAVSTRQGSWSHVVEDATCVLALANTELLKFKALCRRAKARSHLADHLGSLQDYQDAELFVPEKEKKALQRDINTATNIVMRAKQEQAHLARKKAAKKAQKEPLRSIAYGKVTVEELDSDDEEEAPEDDPLAEAGLRVRATMTTASNATVDVHARAQEAMEKYKKAVADAAAAAKAAQRSRASITTPAKSTAPHAKDKPELVSNAANRATLPAPTAAAVPPSKPLATTGASCSHSHEPKCETAPIPRTEPAQPAPSCLPAGPTAAPKNPPATPVALVPPVAVAPDQVASSHPSSSGSDSSYVLVDAPATDAVKAPSATAQEPSPPREVPQGRGALPSGPAAAAPCSTSGQDDSHQGKADIMRVKGIDAWKAGDVPRALGLWSQAAQVAPKDYRVHLNISQALLRLSRYADALAAANTALEALETTPGAPTDLVAKAQYRRGVALQELQKFPEALAALEASHKAMPTPETFAAVAKLRKKVGTTAPGPAAATAPTPANKSAKAAPAEADRAPWGTSPDAPAQQRDTRTSGESDSSFVHVSRSASASGAAATEDGADANRCAPAGAMRPTMESLSADGSAHADTDEADGPAPAVVPASELESLGEPDSSGTLRRFKVPIQDPPASAEAFPTAGVDVVPGDDTQQHATQSPCGVAAAALDSGSEPAIRESTAGGSAGGPAPVQAPPAPSGGRPESPQDLAEQALRVGRQCGVVGGGGGGANAVLPLPPLPATAHELLQAVQGLRRAGQTKEQAEVAVAAYVRSVPPADYPKVIKSNLDGRIVAELIAALKATVASDKAWCKECLMGLVGVERVNIVLVMLPAVQKQALAGIKAQLELTSEESARLACIR